MIFDLFFNALFLSAFLGIGYKLGRWRETRVTVVNNIHHSPRRIAETFKRDLERKAKDIGGGP